MIESQETHSLYELKTEGYDLACIGLYRTDTDELLIPLPGQGKFVVMDMHGVAGITMPNSIKIDGYHAYNALSTPIPKTVIVYFESLAPIRITDKGTFNGRFVLRFTTDIPNSQKP